MDRSVQCWLIISCLLAEQVRGIPLFWGQQEPDCKPAQGYDVYQQVPSYDETLKEMMQETLAALRDIIIVTAEVTKKELQAWANEWYGNQQSGCGSSSTTETSEYGLSVKADPQVESEEDNFIASDNKELPVTDNESTNSYITFEKVEENRIIVNNHTLEKESFTETVVADITSIRDEEETTEMSTTQEITSTLSDTI